MSLGDPIPVRFSVTADQRLTDVARRSGLSKAELIRLATDEFLARVAASGVIEQRIVLAGENGTVPGRDGIGHADGIGHIDGIGHADGVLPRLKTKKK